MSAHTNHFAGVYCNSHVFSLRARLPPFFVLEDAKVIFPSHRSVLVSDNDLSFVVLATLATVSTTATE